MGETFVVREENGYSLENLWKHTYRFIITLLINKARNGKKSFMI